MDEAVAEKRITIDAAPAQTSEKKKKTHRRKKTADVPFVSKAVDKEIRDYQILAAKFPPLKHEELIEASKQFVVGRDAEIHLDEYTLANKILGGDWSATNLTSCRDLVINAFKSYNKWRKETLCPRNVQDVISLELGDKFVIQPFNLDDVVDVNIYGNAPWLEPLTIRDIASEDEIEEAKHSNQVFTRIVNKWYKELEKNLPIPYPKDVTDRMLKNIKEMEKNYTQYMASIRIMDKAQYRELSKKAERGNLALEKVVNHNLQLAMSRISKILCVNTKTTRVPIEELIAVANLGLVMGARQFDPYQGRHFSTYATYHIDGQLFNYVNGWDDTCGLKGLTPHEQKQFTTICNVQQYILRRYKYIPTLLEVQSVTGISKAIIAKRLSTPMIKMQNIHQPIRTTKAYDDFTIAETLKSDTDIETEMNQSEYSTLLHVMRSIIQQLASLHREVLLLMTGIVVNEDEPGRIPPRSAQQIGKALGMSPERVNTVYVEALAELRQQLENRGYDATVLGYLE